VRARRAAFEAVRAAVQVLDDWGALVRTRHASPKRNAEYALRLRVGMAQAEPVPNGTGQPCATGQAEPAQQDRPALRMAQAEPVPEEDNEDGRLTRRTNPHPSQSPHPDARETPDAGMEEVRIGRNTRPGEAVAQ
jgi:hypothetical protein